MKRIVFIVFALFIYSCSPQNKPLTKIVEINYKPGQENRLEKAISEGRVEEVKSLIKKISPDESLNGKEKPIHLAVEKRNSAIVKILLDAGVDVNSVNFKFETPLHIASSKGYLKIAEYLIQKGADTNIADIDGLTPIHYAVIKKHEVIVKLLVNKGAVISKSIYPYSKKRRGEYYRENALSLAIRKSDPAIVEFLLKNTDPNMRINRRYLLEIAIDEGRADVAELLLKKGADPNINKYNPMLFYAVKKDRKDIFRILLEHGAGIWDRSSYRPKNILYTIVQQRKEGFLNVLPKETIDAKDKEDLFKKSLNAGFLEGVNFFYYPGAIDNSNNSRNSLYIAINSKNYELAGFLLSKGAKPDAVVYGQSMLFRSLMNKDSKIAELLLKTGKTDPNHRDRNKWTPLHVAASGDDIDIVKKLIEKGADVNARNYYNITPLVSAFISKNNGMFRYLISKGADYKGTFSNGLSALFLAGRSGNLEALKFFEQKGLPLDVKDSYGSYPYFYSKNTSIPEYYFSKGFDPNHMNKTGRTALFYATYSGNLNLVKFLVDKGADYRKFRGILNDPFLVAKNKRKADLIEFYSNLEIKRILQEVEKIKPSLKSKDKRFIKKEGYILDRKTNLMWAAQDNGSNISFEGALNFCKKYKSGGFSDWRSPEIKELRTLYDIASLNANGYHIAGNIGLTDYSVWSSKQKKEKGARFSFNKGKTTWYGKGKTVFGRALPVRGTLSKGDYREVKKEIEKRDKYGRTYIHQAVSLRSKDLIRTLLEKGADIDAVDLDGKTPLNYAIIQRDMEMTSFLISNKASLEKRNREYLTPLLLACSEKKPDKNIVKLLIENGASIDTKNRRGNTALHELIETADSSSWRRKNTREIISTLIEKGADYKSKNNDKNTALEIAENKGFSDVALLFYKAGVAQSGTLLHLAVLEKNRYKIRNLLEKNPEFIDKEDNLGRTPLHWACINNDNSSSTMLIRKGAKPDLKDKNGKTPLYYSVVNNDFYTSRHLIEKGAGIKNLFDGDTLIHKAVNNSRYINTRLIELLIKKGVKVNAKDHFGKAALHYVTQKSNKYVAEVLIKNGADIEIKDKYGWTPLFYASIYGNSRIVDFLIKKGANKKARDWQKKTPYMRANRKKLGSRVYNNLK